MAEDTNQSSTGETCPECGSPVQWTSVRSEGAEGAPAVETRTAECRNRDCPRYGDRIDDVVSDGP
jgi:hypothetical protein